MATYQPTGNVEPGTMTHFDRVAEEIDRTFTQLIEQLNIRKECLHQKLRNLREEFNSKDPAQRKPPPSFFSPTRDKLAELIESFGDFSDQINYFEQEYTIPGEQNPRKGVGRFDRARGIALDDVNQIIYVAVMGHHQIQMFSFQGEFIKKFGHNSLDKPWGIAVTESTIFVTDISLNSLIRFDKKTLNPIRAEGRDLEKLNGPRGLSVDLNGDVYIADSSNNRITVFSKHLQFLAHIGEGKLSTPEDVKLTADSVVVLDWGPECIHFFTKRGYLLNSCFSGRKVDLPYFFCFGELNNIIISDRKNHHLKVVTRSGALVHTIGSRGFDKGEFEYPHGIAMSEAGTLFVVSLSSDYALQAFKI